jgi:lantibiotic modifying enzyme
MRTTFRSIAPPPPAGGGSDVLSAATGIGERLVREAVWYRGQCNWIGAESDASGRLAHRALGPALGDGTAGIALFLAELHAVTGAEAVRQTARAAIGQALAHADAVPAAAARGLYAGRPGIAYAAARCGQRLGDERLLLRARRLTGARAPEAGASSACGLAGGSAGAIAGLVALARLLGDERLLARAGGLADELAAAARRGPDGWCWPPAPGAEHGLCGLADGAAGVAWALLELFAATGDARHNVTIERALAYERGWYDAAQASWPDLRGVDRRERRGSFTPPFVTSWSHGAPGIALSRVRAWEILGDERSRGEAVTALTTTAAAVERALLAPRADFTLRRGIAGNAEVLQLGAALLPEGEALARRAAEIGVGRYGTSLAGWPGGAGRTPALLTGDAGIGLFLLRRHDATVPSALLVGAP